MAAGLIGTTLPAFGYLPALAGDQFSLTAWSDLIAKPGLLRATWLSFFTGVSATLLSLTIVIAFCASWHGTALFRILLRLLSPLLAVPHVTLAFGLAFLIAPSGWLVRLLSPWLSGFTRPPDWLIIQDPNGLSLIAGLTIKEVPFLLLMTLAALGQSDAARNQPLARTLGYGPFSAWLFTVLPRVYPQLRLPVYAVLAFSISVVDISLVLAPNTPPPLAVLLLRWFNDPDLAQRFVASAGALLQFALVLMAIGLWIGLERVVTYAGLQWLRRGTRWRNDLGVRVCSAIGAILCFSLAFAGLGVLAIWSVASAWRFPDAFPSGISVVGWIRGGSTIGEPFVNTVTLATGSALIATFLVLGCLENEARQGRHAGHRALWLIYLPLLIPQLAFLFGAQILLNALRLDGSWLALLWSHLVFVLPYVFLSLADPYRRWDQRYARSAYCLGASSRKIWWQIKLPMLSRAILTAFAVGFAVSVAQYLPTLFAGAGRYPTLTTEAVNLAASGDRRLIGRYALLQLLLPMMVFWVAVAWPAWRFRHRRGMQVSP